MDEFVPYLTLILCRSVFHLPSNKRLDYTGRFLALCIAMNQASPSLIQHIYQQRSVYMRLMRLERPIGILLLLWPTWWALWLAAEGMPSLSNFIIFTTGVVLMRSAGCVINDYADRKVDASVARTSHRPFAKGEVGEAEALYLFAGLVFLAFVCVLFTNWFTIALSFGALLLAACYPFMKRYTYLPQLVLGAAFSWAVLMAFAAETNALPNHVWLIYIAVVIWTLVYDTFYAMEDLEDDLKIGVKSSAILFADALQPITIALQLFVLFLLLILGPRFELSWIYYLSLAAAAGFFAYQQKLVQNKQYFAAFTHNNWVGAVIFAGIFCHYAVY